jgi:hypothetical protein
VLNQLSTTYVRGVTGHIEQNCQTKTIKAARKKPLTAFIEKGDVALNGLNFFLLAFPVLLIKV